MENFDIDADVTVEASGDLDLRGTLGVNKEAPVGFEDIRLYVSVDGDLGEDTKAALQKVTERYCVVYNSPDINLKSKQLGLLNRSKPRDALI